MSLWKKKNKKPHEDFGNNNRETDYHSSLSLFVFPFPFAGPGPFRDCLDAQEAGHSTSGMYLIKPDEADRPVQVWCEQDIDNGGWTVLQTRKDGSVNFFRNWENYKVLLFFSWVNSFLAQLGVQSEVEKVQKNVIK